MKKLLLIILTLMFISGKSQLKLVPMDYLAEEKFEKYVQARYGINSNFDKWKQDNKILYSNEIWYQSKSFYIIRDFFKDGEKLDESIIDISRFEIKRGDDDESYVNFEGFRDVIVLLPKNKLIYYSNK
jgi:hypothetical protein